MSQHLLPTAGRLVHLANPTHIVFVSYGRAAVRPLAGDPDTACEAIDEGLRVGDRDDVTARLLTYC
jgi:hypothetical protein